MRRFGGFSSAVMLPTLAVLQHGCASAGSKSGSVFATRGSPWTILCMELAGEDRVSFVEEVAEILRKTQGIRAADVRVSRDADGFTRMYYGVHYRKSDPKTGRRHIPPAMQADFDLIRQLGDESGRRYFAAARIVREPVPDVGNPDWRLSRASGKYTLQVAAYEPTDDFWDFKQAAAEHCAFLREKGHEAYYHHGPALSVVTVGAFGPEAVLTKIENGRTITYYSDEVVGLQQDELLRYNMVNAGIVRVRTEEGAEVRVPSQIVHIPQPKESGE